MVGRIDRRDVLALAVLSLIGVGIPLWLAAAAGAIGIPSNDDWVYMRGAESLFRTGSIDMPGHTASAIGQVMLVQPLLWLSGGDPWAFTAFSLMMALIGVASSYLLARCFLGTGSAVMVGLLVVAFPGFARESAAFMTDVSAFALVMLCLLLGARWLQGDGRRTLLVASVAVGLLGFSIREFAIAAPVAVLVVAWTRNRADKRFWLVVLSASFAAGVAWVLVVAGSAGAAGPPSPLDPRRLIALAPAFTTLAAVLLPAATLAMGRRMAKFNPAHLVLGAGLVCLLATVPGGPMLGNLWMADGLGGNALLSGSRDPVIGERAWALSEQLALFAAIIAAALALRWGQRHVALAGSPSMALSVPLRIARSREAPLVLFLFAYAGELIAFASLGYLLDRYLYPMAPAAAILLLRGLDHPSSSGRSRAFSHAALAWLAASAFAIAANSFAYDAARWRAGEAAVAMGYDARTVDAGYEWVGYHMIGSGSAAAVSHEVTWYRDTLMSARVCAVLSNSPLDTLDLRLISVDQAAYLRYLFFGPAEPLHMYGVLEDGCPQLLATAAGETRGSRVRCLGT